MSYPLFGFQGQNSPDQTIQPGLQQYLAQGQQGINPGQAQVAASNPIASAGMANLAKAFAQPPGLPMSQPPQTPDGQQAAYSALASGAGAQPNMNGINMGGVGPTVNNAAALPNYQQQLAAMLMSGSNG